MLSAAATVKSTLCIFGGQITPSKATSLKQTGHIPHCPSQKSIAKDSCMKHTSPD